jgi:hypothetical protein
MLMPKATKERLNDEYVTFQNSGEQPLDISGGYLKMQQITAIHSRRAPS